MAGNGGRLSGKGLCGRGGIVWSVGGMAWKVGRGSGEQGKIE